MVNIRISMDKYWRKIDGTHTYTNVHTYINMCICVCVFSFFRPLLYFFYPRLPSLYIYIYIYT